MATQMTRAQYQATYGSAPVLSSSKIDTRPAPIKMTQAEYDAQYRPQKSNPNVLERLATVGGDTANRMSNAQAGTGDFQDSSLMRRGIETTAAGFTTIPRGALALAPEPVRNVVESVGSFIGKGFNKLTGAIGDTDLFRGAVGQVLEDGNGAARFEKNDLGVLEDVLGTASAGGEIAGTILGTKEVLDAPKTVKFVADKINITPLVKRITTPSTDQIEVTRVKDLSKLEDSYSQFRRLNEFQTDGGIESRSRIARSNVLEGVADENGVIRTKGKGGAVEQYRKATIDGVEDVVKRNLDREGKSVTLPQIKAALIKEIATKSGLEGADLTTALKGVERELSGLGIRMDELGQVSLSKLQDAKINTTKNINFNTPPETATYRKAVARTYKNIIEKNSDFNVKEVNAELAKFYKDIERLEMLDGKRVKGARLGKYFAQISGNIVGGATGTAIGGPIGAAVGAIAGGEAASFISGKTMSRAFGKGGVLPEKNPVLAAAREQAGLPAGRSLQAPDPAVGIPASVKARIAESGTPKQKAEVSLLERQMRDNIDKQKAAIKAKDFTLVSSLKEVYDSLVTSLKELVAEIVESIKNPTIGLAIKSTVTPKLVAQKMDFEDLQDITTFLEDPQASLLNDKLNRMVDEMGIGKADLDTQTKFLIEVTNEADQMGLLQSNNLGKRNTQYSPTATINKNVIDSTVDSKSAKVKSDTVDKSATAKPTSAKEAIAKGLTEEQFVKSQGTPVFRGAKTSELKATSGDVGTGFYFAENKGVAKTYAGETFDENLGKWVDKNPVHEYVISPKAKIVDEKNMPNGVDRQKWATENNYDGVRYKQGATSDSVFNKETNLIIYNKDVLKTTSQLRAEYQAAKGGKTNRHLEAS